MRCIFTGKELNKTDRRILAMPGKEVEKLIVKLEMVPLDSEPGRCRFDIHLEPVV